MRRGLIYIHPSSSFVYNWSGRGRENDRNWVNNLIQSFKDERHFISAWQAGDGNLNACALQLMKSVRQHPLVRVQDSLVSSSFRDECGKASPQGMRWTKYKSGRKCIHWHPPFRFCHPSIAMPFINSNFPTLRSPSAVLCAPSST